MRKFSSSDLKFLNQVNLCIFSSLQTIFVNLSRCPEIQITVRFLKLTLFILIPYNLEVLLKT